MSIFNVFTLLGGLAIFIYGMNLMGEGLEKRSGDKLKIILEHLTSSPLKGLILGIVVTAVIQSSSATTVMVVGFVNSGIMNITQSIGVLMGSNIGTTMTAWILSLTGIEGESFLIQLIKPSTFAPILAFIGVVFTMFTKSENKKNTALVLIGFAILMTGMDLMSAAVEPLSESEAFQRTLILFENPILGVIVGTLLTAIIQSSSASVGILQALSISTPISFATAIPIILGQNIGTTVTALLSSIGTNRNARRTAVLHFLIKVIGVVVFLIPFYIIQFTVGFDFLGDNVTPASIAIFHTVFNLISTLVLFPFCKQLEKLAYRVIKDTDVEEEVQLLDERLIPTQSIAIARAKKVTNDMAHLSRESVLMALGLMQKYNQETVDKLYEMEEKVDNYEDKLGTYLVKLSRESLNTEDAHTVSTLLHTIGNFERLSDHAINIVKVAKELHDKNLSFSSACSKEIKVITDALIEIMDITTEAFVNNDLEKAKHVEPLEQLIDKLNIKMKNRHIMRLQQGDCSIEAGFVFSDLLTNYERVADHCSNIAVCLIEVANDSFETHEYLSHVKFDGENDFVERYEEYTKKYII